MCDMLDVSHSLEEGDEDDIPRLVIQLEEGIFIVNL